MNQHKVSSGRLGLPRAGQAIFRAHPFKYRNTRPEFFTKLAAQIALSE
jgi:hypothetical protein